MMSMRTCFLHISGILLWILGFFTLQACDPVNENPPVYPVKAKTILVYMAGNNNLSFDLKNNFVDLGKGFVPHKEEGNLVVYIHTQGGLPKLVHLYKNEEGKVVRDTVYHFPSQSSATAAALKSAIQVTSTMFPAEENGLLVSSHATGWLPTGYYSSGSFSTPVQTFSSGEGFPLHESPWPAYPGGVDPYAGMVKTFGADNANPAEIEIVDFVKALPHKFNFVIFDACLMGGIEVAYQMKDSVDYLVFSPTEVLAAGYHYAGMMEPLFQQPTNLKGMAQGVYDYYMKQSGTSRSATISVVKCSALPAVAQAAKVVFDKYRENIATLNVLNVQPYFRSNRHWFYDVNDFIRQVAGNAGATEAAAFRQALENAVIYKASTGQMLDLRIDPAKFSGISTYIPNPYKEDLVKFYRNFEWEKAVGMVPELPQQ